VSSVPNLSTDRRSAPPTQPNRRKRETLEEKSARAKEVAARLARAYPEVECPLAHDNAFQLLVAVILSAQCTDAAVNKVTPELFRHYATPLALSAASQADIESLIRILGYFAPRQDRSNAAPRSWCKNLAARCRRPWKN
jgi:Predicted EndoIII-related endonuclease